jgi:hypothetical protein
LGRIVGSEPTPNNIIDTINYILTNNFHDKKENIARVTYQILNDKNSQLRSFIMNSKNTTINEESTIAEAVLIETYNNN